MGFELGQEWLARESAAAVLLREWKVVLALVEGWVLTRPVAPVLTRSVHVVVWPDLVWVA